MRDLPLEPTTSSGAARLLLINQHVVEELLEPHELFAAVQEAFVLHSQREGRVFPLIRERLATGGIFGIKAGDVPSQALLGFKAAGFWPDNRLLGSEPHQATIVLIDPVTGRPQCVIDGNAITTARTAASGAIGLQILARADSVCVTVFGTGVQAQAQLSLALKTLPSLRQVHYVCVNRQPNAAFEALFAPHCDLRCAVDANAAVASSDVVITATPGGGALFDVNAVRPGTHLNCVGADTRGKRELPPGLLARVHLVVDDCEQAREVGEYQWAPEALAIELGDLLTGKTSFQRHDDDITVFDLTGLALQDLTVARFVYQRALQHGRGTCVAWPW